jgi:proteic killer suppression protein
VCFRRRDASTVRGARSTRRIAKKAFFSPNKNHPNLEAVVNAAVSLEDLKVPPANRLEKLKGNLKEFYSIRIGDQWRMIFRWVNGEAHDVRIVDYH